MLGVAGVDALSLLYKSEQRRGAEDHRDGVHRLPHPPLSRHQARVGRLARVGRHTLHHTLQGQPTHTRTPFLFR